MRNEWGEGIKALSPGNPWGEKDAKPSGCGGACPTRTGRWEIPGGRMFTPARVMLPAPCGWDSRLHTDTGRCRGFPAAEYLRRPASCFPPRAAGTAASTPTQLRALRNLYFFNAPFVAGWKGMRIIGIIPARYASTRFPGKPLARIAGKPLIQHVVERCRQAESLSEIIVATDDTRIWEVAQNFCRAEMTSAGHPSGTDRLAEVMGRCECDAAVNIQGDEPLIEPAVIDAVAGALAESDLSTAATRIHAPGDYENPNVVKVVVNAAGRALYFSRRTIPCLREAAGDSPAAQLAAFPFLKHIGIYGYRREALLRLVRFPVSPLEQAEKLEQLRALENGLAIAVARVNYDSVGVDVPADVARVERLLAERK